MWDSPKGQPCSRAPCGVCWAVTTASPSPSAQSLIPHGAAPPVNPPHSNLHVRACFWRTWPKTIREDPTVPHTFLKPRMLRKCLVSHRELCLHLLQTTEGGTPPWWAHSSWHHLSSIATFLPKHVSGYTPVCTFFLLSWTCHKHFHW